MTDATPDDTRTNAPEFTVSEISQAVKRTIEGTFDHVRVRGEVGRLTRPGSGHVYFDLKDENAVIAAVAWKGTAARWRFQPEQGLEVIVTGRLTTFPGQSKYQIVVETVEPAGIGALMALLDERRRKLEAEGLFAAGRKQPLPYLPRVIGVVTSPTGAVIRDILHRLEDRFPTHVLVWPVRVQGETCAAEVAAAVAGFNALPADGPIPRPDLLIVARGGGSVEDLWGFNEEAVVRAVAASAIPVISAVGHETDVTLIDYAADLRAPTPTGAAELAVPVRAELIDCVEDFGQRQRAAARRLTLSLRDRTRAASAALPRPAELLSNARQRVDHAALRLEGALGSTIERRALRLAAIDGRLAPHILARRHAELVRRVADLGGRIAPLAVRGISDRRRALPSLGVFNAALAGAAAQSRQRLTAAGGRIAPAMLRLVDQRRQRLAGLGGLLASLSYKSVIARGFALVTRPDGTLVRHAGELAAGDGVLLEFADGTRGAVIDDKARTPAGKAATTRGTGSARGDKGQSSLF